VDGTEAVEFSCNSMSIANNTALRFYEN
jgi:hypothetical protein